MKALEAQTPQPYSLPLPKAGYAIGGPAPYIDKIKNVTTTQTQTIVEYQLTLAKGQCEFLAVPALEP